MSLAAEQIGTDGPPVPSDVQELLGHDDALKAFQDALDAGRMPHAWLISGPKGIGKATFAYRIARSLLGGAGAVDAGPSLFGDDLPASDPMPDLKPEQITARLVASGAHPDLLTVARAWDEKKKALKRVIAVDEVRKIGPFLRQTASEGGWRIVILDGAEAMQREGQNAILKILEEPPEKALLMLLTDRPGSLVPTIRSRCRMLGLNALSDDTMMRLLPLHAPQLSEADSKDLCAYASGSIGRALEIAEDDGLALYRELISLLDGGEVTAKALFGFADRMMRGQGDRNWNLTSEGLLWWLRGKAQKAALDGAADAKDWLALWTETRDRLEECDRRALDRRSAMDIILAHITAKS